MGIFDFFRRSSNRDGATVSSVRKWAETVSDKRAQTYDRQEALGELEKVLRNAKSRLDELESAGTTGEEVDDLIAGIEEGVTALLRRFTFTIDPSITDQEERESAFRAILEVKQRALVPIRAFAEKTESLAWPMRLMKELLSRDEFTNELVAWLGKWDTEYAKFIDPKIQILAELEEHRGDALARVVEPFLLDVNETARYHAVCTLLLQRDDKSIEPLASCFADEESLRIRDKIAEAFVQREWVVPEGIRADFKKSLPTGFGLDEAGTVKKRASYNG